MMTKLFLSVPKLSRFTKMALPSSLNLKYRESAGLTRIGLRKTTYENRGIAGELGFEASKEYIRRT